MVMYGLHKWQEAAIKVETQKKLLMLALLENQAGYTLLVKMAMFIELKWQEEENNPLTLV